MRSGVNAFASVKKRQVMECLFIYLFIFKISFLAFLPLARQQVLESVV